MKTRNKFIFSILAFMLLLVLISCTTTNIIETPISLTSTPSPPSFPTKTSSATTHTPSTSISSTSTLPSPTEFPISTSNGRILFLRNSIKDDVNSNGLVLLNLKTKELILVVRNNQELNGQTLSLSYPNITWSPDGHWIAFVAVNIEKNFFWYAQEDIYIVKSDGIGLRQLTRSPHYNKRDIAWSPDGKNILVAMGINGSDLYLIDAASGEITKRLTSNGNNYLATWSPDGNKIAYIEETENSVMLIMNVADKTSQQIDIPFDHHVLGISWSPNDELIAFTSSIAESKCADIFAINLKTNEMTNLTSSKYYERFPDWLPDGNNLIFSKSVDICDERVGPGRWDIYMANLLGEEHKIVADVNSTINWAPVPSLEVGKRYVITKLGAYLNLRTEPSLNGKILEKLPDGEIVTVIEGFVDIDDYYWWKIRTQDGSEGWAVEVANWYKSIAE